MARHDIAEKHGATIAAVRDADGAGSRHAAPVGEAKTRPLASPRRPHGNRIEQLISYHADRAITELDQAEQARGDEARRSHLELYRLHLYQLGWLRAVGTERAIADRVD